MIGKLNIYAVISTPDRFDPANSPTVDKKVLIASTYVDREDAESYMVHFKEANRFNRHDAPHIFALWTFEEQVQF